VNSVLEMAEPKVISATTLRTKTRDILEEAKFGGGHFIVETFGKPMVAIVGIEEYWALRNRSLDPGQAAAEE
jgi:prevent-host-death family protein